MKDDLSSLNFFALVRSDGAGQLQRLRLTKQLQSDLSASFREQARDLLDEECERIPFTGTYTPDEGEVLVIEPFELPAAFATALEQPLLAPPLDPAKTGLANVRALVAAAAGDPKKGAAELYFQAMDRSRILLPERTIIFTKDVFQRLEDPGLRLGDQVAAAVVGSALVFRSFQTASRLLDLSSYFREATAPEMRATLEHSSLLVEDAEAVVEQADGWTRKRFAFIQQTQVLDHYTPKRIADTARSLGITLESRKVDGKQKIVVPESKRGVKDLLRVLNEEYFRGPLSKDLYLTNSKRRVKK